MSPEQTEVSWGLKNGEGKRSSETPSCMPDGFRLGWQRMQHSGGGNNQGIRASQQKGKVLCDVTLVIQTQLLNPLHSVRAAVSQTLQALLHSHHDQRPSVEY